LRSEVDEELRSEVDEELRSEVDEELRSEVDEELEKKNRSRIRKYIDILYIYFSQDYLNLTVFIISTRKDSPARVSTKIRSSAKLFPETFLSVFFN
jgi:hypothetical protein